MVTAAAAISIFVLPPLFSAALGGYLVLTSANPIVMHRLSEAPQPEGHIHRYLGVRELRRLLAPSFEVLKHTTIMPRGDRGFLRLVNAPLLHAVLWRAFGDARVQRFKDWCGWGYTYFVVARLREAK